MSAAGIEAVSCCVVLMNVVGNVVVVMPLFHCTTEHGRKLPPVTLIVNAAVPAVALTGNSEETVGTDSEAGAVTEKLTEFDMTEPLDTVIGSDPWNAASAEVSNAVSCVVLTNVVARGEPIQLTTEPLTKFVPFTVNVMPDRVQAAAEELVTVVIAGGKIVNGLPPDVPPLAWELVIST